MSNPCRLAMMWQILAAMTRAVRDGCCTDGFTAEEAAELAGIDTGSTDGNWWHRFGDLKPLGYLEPLITDDGRHVRRPGRSGHSRGVYVLTDKAKGKAA